MKDTTIYPKLTLHIRGILRTFDNPPVMGIINLTPDSFYAKSRVQQKEDLIKRVGDMLSSGAGMIDMGGYSSRPGAADVSVQEEIDRVVESIQWVIEAFPEAIVSVDTFRTEVAELAIKSGASVINDISGGMMDEDMFRLAGNYKTPYVLMHMRGTPQNMSANTHYENLIEDIKAYFAEQIDKAKAAGIKEIILDPGLGFSKTPRQNFEVLHHLDEFRSFGYPILIGASRKSMVYKTLNITPEESLNGTTVVNTFALLKGAAVLRVHDVAEAVQAVKLVGAMNQSISS